LLTTSRTYPVFHRFRLSDNDNSPYEVLKRHAIELPLAARVLPNGTQAGTMTEEQMVLLYTDIDGDKAILSSDADLADAINQFVSSGSIKIFVKPIGDHTNASRHNGLASTRTLSDEQIDGGKVIISSDVSASSNKVFIKPTAIANTGRGYGESTESATPQTATSSPPNTGDRSTERNLANKVLAFFRQMLQPVLYLATKAHFFFWPPPPVTILTSNDVFTVVYKILQIPVYSLNGSTGALCN
jgi:hypothetical protein